MTLYYDVFQCPLGDLTVAVDEAGAVTGVWFLGERHAEAAVASLGRHVVPAPDRARTAGARTQLLEYFDGRRRAFTLPLAPAGTEFQLRVWRALMEIPFGETRSYGQIARAIGAPYASRAVGGAAGANKIPVIIPCHRCIGADGSLTGFTGGLEIKRYLLALEGCL